MRANQIILMFTCLLLLCSTMNAQETGTVTDIDGNVYQTVKIGDQWWMAENLKTIHYNNDTAIDYPGRVTTVWKSDTTGAYAWYNNDESNKEVYGALYNWHAVNTGNLCPVGWHVPTDEYCTYFAFFHSLGLYSSDVLRYVTSKQNGYSVRCVRDD